MREVSYIGVGLYSLSEASRILQVRPSTLSRWIQGYTYYRRGTKYQSKPLIRRYFADRTDPLAQPLTFLELIELLFVKIFRNHGVTMPTIRRAAEAATSLFETDYPFAVKRFDTDGKYIFATLRKTESANQIVVELTKRQIVFESVMKGFFRKIDYQDRFPQEARRYWPLGHERRVVIDPEREFGRPIDAETGVPTTALYTAVVAEGKERMEIVAKWFRVPLEAVKIAVEYEEQLAAA